MDMNIKGVEKELVGQMKAAASLSGVTLKVWVKNVLTQAIANKVELTQFVEMQRLQGGGTGRRGSLRGIGNSGSKWVSRDVEAPDSGSISGDGL